MIELPRILCAVDFSDFSRRALNHALSVARSHGSAVTVLHVIAPAPVAVAGGYYFGAETPPPLLLSTMDRETATRELERLVRAEPLADVKVDTVVAESFEVHREILAQAARLHPSLVVLGTHGRSGFERLFLGSTAEKVLRKASCPVMTVPPTAPDARVGGPVPFRQLVCGIDFSKSSRAALDYAMSLAREDAAALAVVHVIDTHPMYVDFAPPAAFDLHAWTGRASAGLHALVPEKLRASCHVTEVVREGTPHREILGLARELDADLIVLGVHGRGAADLFFFGSTTHHVVRQGHCAVLTVRG